MRSYRILSTLPSRRTALPTMPWARSTTKRWLSSSDTPSSSAAPVADEIETVMPEYMFTLAEYHESQGFGLGKGTQFCLLSLKHPLITADHEANDAFYKAKQEIWPSRAEEIFKSYDKNASGTIDAKELTEALEGIGLPPTDDKVTEILCGPNYGGSDSLNLTQFSDLLQATWGQGTAVQYYNTSTLGKTWEFFRESAGSDDEATWAAAWVGRMPPAHFVLRALRWTWPGSPVKSIALMRNTRENPGLDPKLMEVHDDTYFPSVSEETSTIVRLARFATKFDPFEEGGFVVRIEENERTFYVPFMALPVNGAWSSSTIGPQVPGFEKLLFGLPWFGAGGVLLGGAALYVFFS